MTKIKWTYETRYLDSEWMASEVYEDTPYDASRNAAVWMVTCQLNGMVAEVRLKEIRK